MLQQINDFIDNNKILTLLIFFILIYGCFKLVKYAWFKYKFYKNQKKLAQSGIEYIDKMDGLQFETYLMALFNELGYKSKITIGSHDFGADLIMKKENEKISVQAKRYGYKNKVGISAIQEVYTSIPFYNTQRACVITNSFFTKSAYKIAKACNVKLINRIDLIEYINQINPEITAKQVTEEVEPEARKCPECKAQLVVRTSKNNKKFFGCSNFPKCNHTESINK